MEPKKISLQEQNLNRTLEYTSLPTGIEVSSAAEQTSESFKSGVNESLITGLLPDVIGRMYAGSLDKENGIAPLSKKSFEENGYAAYGQAFEHDPSETPSQTQLRFDRFIERDIAYNRTQGGSSLQKGVNFASGFVGGFVGDAPLAFVPYTAVASRAATASKALQTGWKQAAMQTAKDQTKKAAQYEAAMASGSKFAVAKTVAVDYFKESAIASTVETGLWGAASEYLGDDVGMGDLAINAGFSMAASAPFSAFGVRNAWQEQGKILKYNEDVNSVVNFLENGDTTRAAFKLADFYEPAKKLARENEEFTFLMQEVEDIADLSPEQLDAANRFSEQVTAQEMKNALAQHLLTKAVSQTQEGGPSAEDFARDIKEQTARIYKAIDDRTHLSLSEADWEALVLSGYTPSQGAIDAREAYLNSIDYAQMTFFRPELSKENSETATRALRDYDGPELVVYLDYDIDTIARVNPETGEIRINTEKVTEDWEAGMPHLTGEGESASSAQKKVVFENIDIDKLRAALKDEQGYLQFILAHETGHAALKHSRIKRSDWLSDEAVNQEIAANEYAAELMGIDWSSLTKKPQMEFNFTPETRNPTSAKDIPSLISYAKDKNIRIATFESSEGGAPASVSPDEKGEIAIILDLDKMEAMGPEKVSDLIQEEVIHAEHLLEIKGRWDGKGNFRDFANKDAAAELELMAPSDVLQYLKEYADVTTSKVTEDNVMDVVSRFPLEEKARIVAELRQLNRKDTAPTPAIDPTSPNPLAPPVTSENFADIKSKLNDAFNNQEINAPKQPQQAELALESQKRIERNLGESSSLENDRAGYFTEQTNEVLGSPEVLGLILSTPDGYNSAADKGNVARKDHVRTVLEQNNLSQYSDVAESIVELASRKEFYDFSVNKFFDDYNPKNRSSMDFDQDGIPEDLKTSVYILIGENSDDLLKARTEVLKSLTEGNNAEILRTVRNAKIENAFVDGANEFESPKQRIEWLQSQLDGQQRAGFNPQSSANVKSKAQIVVDAKPINDVLEKHGLWDVFIGAGHGPYLEVLRKQTGGNEDAIKIYGKDLRANVNAFAGDLMVAMRTGVVPDKWKGVDAFEELVDAIKSVRESQLVALNRLGSNVRVRSDFSGWSQRWSSDTIKSIGFDRFRTDMLNGVDWEATAKAHGGRLTRKDGKDVPFDRETYLKEWYYRIVELKEVTEGSDVAKSFEQSRSLILKSDAEAKILAKYSGEGNLGKLLMDQIRYRSEMIATLEFFGSKPMETIQNTLDRAQLSRGDNVGKFKYDTVLGTTKLLINELDNPVDASFASIFKTVRKVGNLAFLPLSGFSALMDIPLSVSTLKYTGAEIGVNEFMPQFIAAMSRQFKGDKTGMSAYFRDVGAAYDVVNNANLRQITGDVSGEKGFLDIAMSFMFEANGMLRTTAAGQEAFADWTSRSLGKEAAAGKFNELRLESLRNFGFSDAEIDVLLKSASKEAPDGISRVMPQTVEDANVSNKLREYYLHYMKQAVLEPDAGAQAITRGNFKAGTVGGEVMRTGFQYSSFILGLSRVIFNRFANGYTGSQLNHVRAMSHLVAFVGTSLATAWFVKSLKDLSRGRAPINPLNMSSFEMESIIMQSGLVGVGEIPLGLLSGDLPLSPVAKTPIDLGVGIVTGDGKKKAKAIAPYVGGSLPVVGDPIKSMLAMAFTQAAGDIVVAELDYLKKF